MPNNRRQGEIARAVFEVLIENPEGLPKAQLLESVQERIPPTSREQTNPETILGPWTIGLARAGWLIKDKGQWSITDKGRAAYRAHPEPEALQHEWNQLYQAWSKKQP